MGDNHTCRICNGAIPDGVALDGHTALCAEVIRQCDADADTTSSERVLRELDRMLGGEREIVIASSSGWSIRVSRIEGGAK